MANCRLKYSQDVINTIYDMVGVGRNSAVITKPNTILLPVGGIDGNNSKLKTKNNTYKWAKSLESEINKHFESHNFGNIITVDNESNQQGTLLYITVPKLLIDAIEVKNGERDREILLKEMEQRDLEGNQKFNEEGDVYYQINEKTKEGISFVFEQNPELKNIGTPRQYSQYLDTIFPDSTVKDIVYRGGNITKEEFEESEHTPTDYMDLGIGLYLTPNKRFAENYGTPRATVVNIKNPKDASIAYQERADYGQKEENYGIPQLDSNGKYDGIVDLSKDFKTTYELVVFKPEQIHILGSKQDIEGFKNWIKDQISTTQIVQPDVKLKSLLLEFCKKNNIKVEFIDSLLNSFGYDYTAVYNTINQTISIAKSKEKSDTLSEEVGHAVLEGLGDNHVLVKRLYELISQIDYESQLDPEYITAYKGNSEKLIKELAGQLLSKGIINNFNNVDTTPQIKNILPRIWEYFVSLFKNANQSDLESIKEEINKITDVLAGKILKNENLNLVTPIKPVSLFQINKPKYVKETYEKHVLLIKRRINSRKQLLKKLKVDSTDYNKVNSEIEALTSELSKFEKTGDIEILYNIGKAALIAVEKYISKLETGKVKLSSDNSDDWSYTEYVIDTFKTFKGLSDQALELEERLLAISETTVEDLVNSHSTEKDKVTYEKVMSQNQDINRFSLMFGALVDLGDYLARTIGSLIKEAQNKISSFQKKLATDIEKERDLLLKWAKDNSLNEDNMYDIFIQDFKNTTVLTREYSSEWYENLSKAFKEKNYGWIDDNAVKDDNGKFLPIDKKKWSNPNYKKIQSTPELKRFYEFYQKTIKEAFDKLPVNNRTDFIPNIYKQTVSDIIKTSPTVSSKLKGVVSAFTGVSSKHTTENGYVNNEELEADVVPFKYIKSIDASKKSKNLADVLYKFGAFAESHNILSDVLPKARLLQKHIQKKKYIKSSSPNEGIAGINTNLNEMVKKVIDMQIKDKMKLDEIKLPIKSIYNDKGEKIGEKYIHMSDVVDYGLRYNSVLRIGLNPLNAVVNVLVGDIGNIVEGFGGRYYSLKELKKATDIYTTQRLKDNSKLINIMGILNPLQEMEDYQLSKNLSSKKVDIDKAKNFMYAPQRMGEDFLQTRTMIAIMLKTKLPGTNVSVWDAMGEDGNLKKEYINNFKDNKEIEIFLNRITDKVQRVNQMIHGRYSERDAATIQQSVLWRMIFQFKKWIPAAIEQRFGKFQEHDSRLGDSIEGRWRTAYRLFTKAYLEKSLKSLQAGNMTELELYNMRKNLAELAIFAGVILVSGMLGWDDDDERKRNPYYKMTMSTLDRVSGDLLFFANPKEQTRLVNSSISMASTVKDMIKVFETIPYALFGEEDKRKTSLPERIAKVIPGAKPAKEVFEFFNEEKYKNYSGS